MTQKKFESTFYVDNQPPPSFKIDIVPVVKDFIILSTDYHDYDVIKFVVKAT